MATTLKIIGIDQVTKKYRRIVLSNLDMLEREMARAGLLVQSDARKSIQRGSRSGKTVTIGGKSHTRSAPGEPPKTDTGRLVANIFSILSADKQGVIVGTDIAYGKRLEFGFTGSDAKGRSINQGARPWLQPAFERMKPKIQERFSRQFRRANRRAAGK